MVQNCFSFDYQELFGIVKFGAIQNNSEQYDSKICNKSFIFAFKIFFNGARVDTNHSGQVVIGKGRSHYLRDRIHGPCPERESKLEYCRVAQRKLLSLHLLLLQ